VSNPEFPGPYQSGSGRNGRPAGARGSGEGRYPGHGYPARDGSGGSGPAAAWPGRDAGAGRGGSPGGGRANGSAGRGRAADGAYRHGGGWAPGEDGSGPERGWAQDPRRGQGSGRRGGEAAGRDWSRRDAGMAEWEQGQGGNVTALPGRGGPWEERGAAPGGRTGLLPGRGPTRYGPSGPGGPGGPGGGGWEGRPGRPRRGGDWWRRWTLRKAVAVLACAAGAMVVVLAAGVAYAYSKTPIPSPQSAALQQASTVYFSDGKTVIGQFGSTDRQVLTYNQIPAVVRNAVVAAEDKNFWHEGGISPTGILRAAYYDLTSSGGNLQGGSTITQQLVRNYYEGIGTSQTLSRKIKEIFVAEKLSRVKSKVWVLTQYLNTVSFGKGAYGIGAAAQVYFGVPASKLTVSQAAMLAAMIQSPYGYDPSPAKGQAYTALVARWHYVLNMMVTLGTLSQQSANQQKFPTVALQLNTSWSGYTGYLMQAVQYELQNTYHYSLSDINNMGLHVVTTFSKKLMNDMYATVRQNERLMRHCTPPSYVSAAPAPCTGLPKYVRVGALLEQPGTGAILAMYSGKNYNKIQYDNALESRNQVGSSFKPYVLATAVKMGMNVRTSILNGDSPLWIPPDSAPMTYAATKKPLTPGYDEIVNDESGNNNLGPVSVETATAASLNTAYTDLWHRVALDPVTHQYNVVNMAKAFGVDPQASGLWNDRDLAGTALGQASLTVEEQATTIATLAANGLYSTPHVIQKIIVGNPASPSKIIPAKITHRQVLTPAQAADVDWAMSFDTSGGGTAAGLGLTNGQTVIAKTGTTNLSQSAFFMGATPREAMAVGMFVERPTCNLPAAQQYLCHSTSALAFAPPPGLQTLFGVGGWSGYGGQWPAVIWHTYFLREFNGMAPVPWPPLNNDGAKWNLMGKLPPKKPKHKPVGRPRPGPGCQGRGNGQHCRPSPTPPLPTITPSPTAPPTPTPSPIPSPTSTRKHGGGANTLLSDVIPALPEPVAVLRASGREWARAVLAAMPAVDSWLPRLRAPSG
jgi:membrane peptidoglycan carboxypeptidase